VYKDKSVEKAIDRQSIAGIILLFTIVFLAPLFAGKLSPIPALAIQILVFLTALLWVIRAAREGLLRLPGRWITYPLGVLFVLLVLSAIGSASLHATIRELANIASYLLVFLMITSLRGNRPAVYGILASLIASAFLVGVLGIKEYMLAPHAGWRVFSTFFNPDFLAGFMALILPIALAWYVSRTSLGVSIGVGVIVLVVFSNILLSGSRFGSAAAVGGVGVLLAFALVSRSLKKEHLIKMLILVPLLALIYLSMGKPLAGRISATRSESHSGGFRIYTWKGTAGMAEANPINGTGLGTFEIAYPKYALVGFTKLAHNSYLQLAAEAGPLAAIALIVLLGSSTLPLGRMLIRKQAGNIPNIWMPEAGLMASGLIGGAAASMARNLVDSDWYITAIGISFWAVLGMVVASTDSGRVRPAAPRGLALFIGLIGLVVLGLAAMLAGEMFIARGNSLWRHDPESAIRCYRQAAKLDPLSAEFHQRIGGAYLSLAKGSGDEALANGAELELKTAIRLEPGSAKSYYQLGKVYEFYPKNEDAIAAFSRALDRSPNAPEVMYALANRYVKSDRAEEALAVWKRMVALEDSPFERVKAAPELVQPEYIFAHIALGQDRERRGDRSGAEREYRRALDRAERYQESVKAMREILEVNNRRDVEMEDLVEKARGRIMNHFSGGAILPDLLSP